MHSTINILLNIFGEKMNKYISPDTADFFSSLLRQAAIIFSILQRRDRGGDRAQLFRVSLTSFLMALVWDVKRGWMWSALCHHGLSWQSHWFSMCSKLFHSHSGPFS